MEERLPKKNEKWLWANPSSQIDAPPLPAPIFYFHPRIYVATKFNVGWGGGGVRLTKGKQCLVSILKQNISKKKLKIKVSSFV